MHARTYYKRAKILIRILIYSRIRFIETPVNKDNRLIGTILQLRKQMYTCRVNVQLKCILVLLIGTFLSSILIDQ